MKLDKEIKTRIDNFFANITAEELYNKSINEYGFTEQNSTNISYTNLGVIKIDLYQLPHEKKYNNNDNLSNLGLAA